MSNKDTMTVINNRTGESFEFPIIDGNIGPSAIDIRSFYAKTGYFTYDPGFTSTASCDSTITYIDGDAGILRHRGYSIEDLTQNCSFLEVVHLLLKHKLPNQQELDTFTDTITHHTMLHEQLMNFYRGFRRDAHPMAIVNGVVGALSSFYHDTTDVNDAQHREIASNRMIAKIPTIVANAYKYSLGQPFIYPSNNLGYVHNFMKMTFGVPCEEYEISPAVVEAMSKIFILHADHEQNASTSTVRLAGSSGANPYACIAAGVASLWGPAHGGANEAVLAMLGEIGSVSNIEQYIAKAKDKNDPFRLMGFGHRVYKNFDPRANVLKSSCHEVLQQLNIDDPLLELAMRLEETALKDDYFIERKLFPNVDFYSGIILKAIGFPTSMFTALFALARTSGWIAQWGEMLADDRQKIGRPRQIFEGEAEKKFVPINQR